VQSEYLHTPAFQESYGSLLERERELSVVVQPPERVVDKHKVPDTAPPKRIELLNGFCVGHRWPSVLALMLRERQRLLGQREQQAALFLVDEGDAL
jgi:hypothetical protein